MVGMRNDTETGVTSLLRPNVQSGPGFSRPLLQGLDRLQPVPVEVPRA